MIGIYIYVHIYIYLVDISGVKPNMDEMIWGFLLQLGGPQAIIQVRCHFQLGNQWFGVPQFLETTIHSRLFWEIHL